MSISGHASIASARIAGILVLFAACSSDNHTPGAKANGGAMSSGGMVVGTGGLASNGGASGQGGVVGVGGTATGGSTSSGGTTTSGGTLDTGGAGGARAASGGSIGTGGGSSRDAADDATPGPDTRTSIEAAVDSTAIDGGGMPGTNNPVLPGLFADPNIVLFDHTFYIYPTSDGFADWGATSFSAFSSPDLVRWTNAGVVLNLATDLKWASGHAWAPGIARVGDTYYFYFTADNQIGVATAKSPTGPFKDALGKPLVATSQYGVNAIDPYVFVDDDGQAYLTFGNSGIRIAKLNPDMVSFAGTPTNITPGGTSGIVVEGSAMFKRKGTYYLQWSEGDTRLPTYRVAYGLAQSPVGPFTRLAVILEQASAIGVLGPGGSTVLAIPSRDEYYLAYHRFKIPGGDGTHRETCIDRLSFNSDGTIVPVKPTLQGLQAAVSP